MLLAIQTVHSSLCFDPCSLQTLRSTFNRSVSWLIETTSANSCHSSTQVWAGMQGSLLLSRSKLSTKLRSSIVQRPRYPNLSLHMNSLGKVMNSKRRTLASRSLAALDIIESSRISSVIWSSSFVTRQTGTSMMHRQRVKRWTASISPRRSKVCLFNQPLLLYLPPPPSLD